MDSNEPREDLQDAQRWAEEDAAADEEAAQTWRRMLDDEDQAHDQALRQAALYALQSYPGEQVRIGKALTIALNEGVKQGAAFGTALVHSESNPEVIYQISGRHCDCPDQAAPGGRCKHRFAYYLVRLAQACLAMQDDTPAVEHDVF
jgi:hypothetical protein